MTFHCNSPIEHSCSFYSSRFSNKKFKIFLVHLDFFDKIFKFHHQFLSSFNFHFIFHLQNKEKLHTNFFPLLFIDSTAFVPLKNIANIRPHPGKHFLQHRLNITLRYIRRFPRIFLIFPEKSHLKNFSPITRLVS